jgi:hypothetical protein
MLRLIIMVLRQALLEIHGTNPKDSNRFECQRSGANCSAAMKEISSRLRMVAWLLLTPQLEDGRCASYLLERKTRMVAPLGILS